MKQKTANKSRGGVASKLLWLACTAIGVATLGIAYQHLAHRRDLQLNPPPGLLIDVGGYRMHINCVGHGNPTVVLDAGLSDSSLSWYKVQPSVAQFARVCSYDRAGLGWSDPSSRPRNSQVFAVELHKLLQNARIPAPFIMVGHSMGGFDVRIYTSLYPSEVVGVVLVDSSHPDMAEHLPELRDILKKWRNQWRRQMYGMPFGIPRLAGWCGHGPPELQAQLRTIECTVSRVREVIAECDSMWDGSATQARKAGTFGDIPLVVVSEDPDKNVKEYLSTFEQGQRDLMHLSSNSHRLVAIGSGHQIQRERPDVVVEAIRWTISANRNSR